MNTGVRTSAGREERPLEAGEYLVAHADGPGRIVFEREVDVLAEFVGALTGVYQQDELDHLRNEWDSPLDGDIATDAAALRANHGSLKLPDALVIATARMLGADLLVTIDRKWPTPQRLQLGAKIRTL